MKLRELFVEVGFKIDTTGTASIGKVNRKVEEFKNVVSSINMAGFIAKVTAVRYALNSLKYALDTVTGVFTSFLKAGSDKERIDIVFEVLTKNVELGKKTLEELHALAVTRPFTVPEVEEGAAVLLAMGFEAENLRDMMAQISDITAALPNLSLKRFAYNLGQVRAATYLRGMELRDFISQGVPLIDELLKLDKFKGLGTQDLRELIEKRQVSFDDVAEAIKNMTSEGGLFFRMSERIMTTLHGMYTNFLDTLVLVRREIGQRLTPIVTPFFQRFIDFFRANRDAIITVIAKPLEVILTLFVNLLEALAYIVSLFHKVIDYTIGFQRLLNLLKLTIQLLIGRAILGALLSIVIKIGVQLVLWKAAIAGFFKLGLFRGFVAILAKVYALLVKIKVVWLAIFKPFLMSFMIASVLAMMIEDIYLYTKYGDAVDTFTGRLLEQFPSLKKGYETLKAISLILGGVIYYLLTGDKGMVMEGLRGLVDLLDEALFTLTGVDNVLTNLIKKIKYIFNLFRTGAGERLSQLLKFLGVPLNEGAGRFGTDKFLSKQFGIDHDQIKKYGSSFQNLNMQQLQNMTPKEARRVIDKERFKPEKSTDKRGDTNVTVNTGGLSISNMGQEMIKKGVKELMEKVVETELKTEPIPGAAQ
jgi:hypothetical protein